MKLKLGILIVIITIFLTFGVVIPASAGKINVAAFVDNAYYGDFDGEGDLDDIQYDITIYVFNFKWFHQITGYEVNLYIGLEYPSGLEYWWLAVIIVYSYVVEFQIMFEDAAFESGNYVAHLLAGSAEQSSNILVYHQLEFDPPGGGQASRPNLNFIF